MVRVAIPDQQMTGFPDPESPVGMVDALSLLQRLHSVRLEVAGLLTWIEDRGVEFEIGGGDSVPVDAAEFLQLLDSIDGVGRALGEVERLVR